MIVAIHKKAKIRDFKEIFKRTVDRKIIILVFAVVVYKGVIESRGAANSLLSDISPQLPLFVAASFLIFIVGFATGIEMSYSSIALPLLTDFVGYGHINSENLMLVIAAGYLGVMLSPLHVFAHRLVTALFFGYFMG